MSAKFHEFLVLILLSAASFIHSSKVFDIESKEATGADVLNLEQDKERVERLAAAARASGECATKFAKPSADDPNKLPLRARVGVADRLERVDSALGLASGAGDLSADFFSIFRLINSARFLIFSISSSFVAVKFPDRESRRGESKSCFGSGEA